jgi:TolB protein
MNPDGSGVRQITSGSFWHSGGKWSPDATQIVCNTEESSTTAGITMVVMNVDGTNRRLLGCGSQMAWSPDGKKIAFSDLPSAELGDLSHFLYVVDVLSGERVQITKDLGLIEGNPSWSTDGKFIYFSSNRHAPSKNNPEIYRINSDGSNIIRITFTNHGYSTSPSVAPDGNTIAFVTSSGIYTMKVDGSEIRKIIQPPPGEVFNYPRWSLDGNKLLFVSGVTDGTTRTYIYSVNIDSSGLRKLLEDSTANSPDWSR